jgi:steroid 5-alpha reductase family enzyme
MTWTPAKGTGAPLTEKRMASSRRGYADCVARTSGFLPRAPTKA